MPVTVLLDTIADAELELTAVQRERVRTGIITGISVNTTPDSLVLEKAAAALAAVGIDVVNPTYYPSMSDMTLRNIRIVPFTYNKVRFFLRYSSAAGGPVSVYTIRDHGYIGQVRSNQLLTTREPIYTSATITLADGSTRFIEDYVLREMPIPVRAVGLTVSFFGQPPTTLRNKQCYVNSDVWLGLPKGFWRLDQINSDYSRNSGYSTVTAVATTKNVEDWSTLHMLRDQYGRFIKVNAAEVAALMTQDYGSNGAPGYVGDYTHGITRISDYPMISFVGVFGFSTY